MDFRFLQSKRNFVMTVGGLGVLGTVLLAVILGAGATELGLAIVGGLGAAGIVVGTYILSQRYGHPHSHSVAGAAIAFGVLYLLAVTYRLLTEFGIRSSNEVIAGLAVAVVGTTVLIGLIAALGRAGPSPN